MGRRRLRAGTLTVALALLGGAVAGVAPARAATFTLSGTVTDDSSTPVMDVVVDLLDPPTGNAVATGTTDTTGHYAISVAEGTYDVRFTPPSGSALAPATISGEAVATDTVLDVVLQPTPPVVTVVAPRNGQIVSDYYDLAATTSAPVDRVEFYIDDVLIGQATAGLGWNYHWNSTTVAEGGHKIQAKAYVGSASALSAPVLFNVKQFAPGQVIDWGQTTNFPAGQGPNGGASVKLVDAQTLVMTQNGKTGASRTYQVSADGKTLTLTQKNEDGRERAKMAFSRQ